MKAVAQREREREMAAVVLVCLFMLVLLVARVASRWQRRRQLPPGPPSWPIIGSLHHLLGSCPHRSLAKLSQKYGPLLFMQLGSMPAVVVSSPSMAKLFLQTHDKTFANRPHFESANHVGYGQESVVASARYGEEWRNLRRLYMEKLFTAKRVKELMPVMVEEIGSLIEEIRGYAEAGVAFNVTAGLNELLENIMCRILIGKRLSEVCDVKGGYSLKEAVHEATALFVTPIIGDLIPWLSFVDGRTKRKMDAWHASFDALIESVLAERNQKGVPSSSDDVHDFLQVLMTNAVSRDKIKGVILELLAAGIDTTAMMLDWAMAELLQNPMVMKKLEQEVEQVMGHSSIKMVEVRELPQLTYLSATIKETFRLHAPAPLLFTHMSTEDCQVLDYTLPQGTQLFINVWSIGRDPKVWDLANVFFPDRFLSTHSHVDLRGQNFELLPFGSGRRSCPGSPLALPILEMTLANIIHYFEWSLPPPPHHKISMEEKFGIVVSRNTPLLAIPTLRSM